MRILIDTGIWLRAFDQNSAERPAIISAFRRMWTEQHEVLTTIQNIAEFWNVATRPHSARGGLGLSLAATELRVRWIERVTRILPFALSDYQEWRRLLVRRQVTGVAVHDARLVATMATSGISHILTLNTSDFQRYREITAVTPAEFLNLTFS